MPMTEEQARTKWCPMVRGQMMTAVDGGLAPVGNGHNRLIHMDINQYEAEGGGPLCCIASGCMAWRSEKQRETVRNYHDAPDVQRINVFGTGHIYPDGWQYSHTDTDRDGRKFDLLHRIADDGAPEVGYCGAFGKPGA